jgi:hypothetical protein
MPRKPFPHLIIISGSGRKVGKTFMVTALIRAFSPGIPLIALKISPHVHDDLGNTTLRATANGIRIFQDLGPHHKNSGQFLEAGAVQSFFMETVDSCLESAFDLFMKECNPTNNPVICESGALSILVNPGVSIFINDSTGALPDHKKAAMQQADLVLPARLFSTAEIIGRISFSENRWNLRNG